MLLSPLKMLLSVTLFLGVIFNILKFISLGETVLRKNLWNLELITYMASFSFHLMSATNWRATGSRANTLKKRKNNNLKKHNNHDYINQVVLLISVLVLGVQENDK